MGPVAKVKEALLVAQWPIDEPATFVEIAAAFATIGLAQASRASFGR